MGPGYLPISAYGAIGNLQTAALVGLNGSIDWCCFPHFDRPSVFGAILDHRKGGRFRVDLPGGRGGDQEYINGTNVLRTRFRTAGGEVSVTDLMPLWGEFSRGSSHAPPEIHRLLECGGGPVEVEVEWSPRFDYARDVPAISPAEGGWHARGRDAVLSLGGPRPEEAELNRERSSLLARLTMQPGEMRTIVTRWNSGETDHDVRSTVEARDRTVDGWRIWAHSDEPIHEPQWAQEHYPLLMRSELVLKLMTHAETGAIVAAPTTSLPEAMGGKRNYDYRYAWVRDASMTAQALTSLGHEKEAIDLLLWIENVSARHFTDGSRPQIMYGVHGESDLEEIELPHLEGYRGSRPVRVGNEAAVQLQLEVPGEVLNTAYELARRGHHLDDRLRGFLSRIMDMTCKVWPEPDQGIWEIRGAALHFTYSKVMLWVAFDRALQFDRIQGLEGDKEQWYDIRNEIRREVLENGYDPEMGAFVQSYGSKELDASNLRIPLQEFLPFDDPRVQGTIDRTMRGLMEDGLVYRYLDDDLRHWGKEGTFNLCTCWLVDDLALSGRVKEARGIFENLVRHCNHVGLLSEQIDPSDGAFLGNFPQAFTHIGLINSVLYLAYAEGRHVPEQPLMGTMEHRVKVNRPHTAGR
ncbi:MAG: glycoside hydrolase family 15 protein [Methanomassiliicoccus sp.]|nr:glycoside hydrolase family 15 protein [Methanomassiliicoccus sp.]